MLKCPRLRVIRVREALGILALRLAVDVANALARRQQGSVLRRGERVIHPVETGEEPAAISKHELAIVARQLQPQLILDLAPLREGADLEWLRRRRNQFLQFGNRHPPRLFRRTTHSVAAGAAEAMNQES